MESGETAEQGNGRLDVQTARQAKRAGPDREAGPEAAAEQREETMEARQGRDSRSEARCAARQRDRPCCLAGDARTSRLDEHHAQDRPHAQGIGKLALLPGLRLVSGRAGAAGSAVFEGRQASRGGDSPQGFPPEASAARSAAGA